MTDLYTEAQNNEEAGEYHTAARAYAENGFIILNEQDFEAGRQFRLGIASLVKALSCDARAGQQRRARAIRDTAASAIRHALREEEKEDRCRDGLYHEWLGDIHLMTRSVSARTHYETARNHYSDASPSQQRTWGMEEEFDYVHWAVESFLEEAGYEDEVEELHPSDFSGRIEIKLDVATSLAEQD